MVHVQNNRGDELVGGRTSGSEGGSTAACEYSASANIWSGTHLGGLEVRNGLDSAMGVELCRVDDHSQLYHSGIREGDVLLAVGTAACLSHTHALLTR